MAEVRIGTSGWTYEAWRHGFYAGVPRARWLEHCGERFSALEINATHYRLQRQRTMERWRDAVPSDFRFAVKGHRFLTHVRRLREPAEPIARERRHAEVLGERLGAVLWQLPGTFERDDLALEGFLRALREGWPMRHVLELRHRSWFLPEIAERLSLAGVSNCISHAAGWPMWEAVTADLVYVRLHGSPRTYASSYGVRGLRPWVDRVERWLSERRDVYVFFDNDALGHAPADARRLMRMLAQA
jgi:uncharacterized protein YecE (DUF72 family)